MYIDFEYFCCTWSFIIPCATLLSNCTGVGPWGWNISWSARLRGIAYFKLMNPVPVSASWTNDIKTSISLHMTCTDPFGGGVLSWERIINCGFELKK